MTANPVGVHQDRAPAHSSFASGLTIVEKREFLLHCFSESCANIRHFHDLTYKVSGWGSAGLVALTVFLIGKSPLHHFWQRIVIQGAALAFALAVFVMLHRCHRVLRAHWRVIVQVDRSFAAFEQGIYIDGQALFPQAWSTLGKPEWKERFIWSLAVPPLLCLVIASLAIFFN